MENNPGLNRDEWFARLEAIGVELQRQGVQAHVVALGSVPNIMAGQPARTTIDFDVWKNSSTFSEKALKEATEKAGLLYNPQGVLEPDKPYLQIVRPGIVQLGEFEPLQLEVFAGLKISQPPPANLMASKLCRANEQDIEDIAWLLGQQQVYKQEVAEVIKTFPRAQRCVATENLIYLDTITSTQNRTTTAVKYVSPLADKVDPQKRREG